MIICVDFDGTIVDDKHAYDDLATPLTFMPGAREALRALRAAGHVLVLYSARSNGALLREPSLNPLVRAGLVGAPAGLRGDANQALNRARYEQMIDFVNRELPDTFDVIWSDSGKPSADLFVDDRAVRLLPFDGRGGMSWRDIALTYGEEH